MAKPTRDDEVNPGAKRAYVKAVHRINATQFEHPGEKTEAFKALGRDRPGRLSAAARAMAAGKKVPASQKVSMPISRDSTKHTQDQIEQSHKTYNESISEWKRRMPQGGGRGVAAPHHEWVAWGSSKPSRFSQASQTMQSAHKPKATP